MSILPPKVGPLCSSCPLYQRGEIVHDYLPDDQNVKLSFVGEMPGRDEVAQRGVLVGSSGQLLQMILEREHRSRPHITNAIRCGLPKGKKPSTEEMKLAAECCKPLVMKNLQRLKPKVVCCLGATSMYNYMGVGGWKKANGYSGIEQYRGVCLPRTKKEPWIKTCTIHPAGLLHQPARGPWIELLRDDINKAYDLALRRVKFFEPDVRDAGDTKELLRFLKRIRQEGGLVGEDVETDGRNSLGCNLRLVGIAYDGVGYSIPWPDYYPDYWGDDGPRVEKALRRLFKAKNVEWVVQNKNWERVVLERYFGPLPAPVTDVMLLHHACYPKVPHALQGITSQFLAIEPWKASFKASGMAGWVGEEMSRDEFAEELYYNAVDAIAPLELHPILMREVEELGVSKVAAADQKIVDVATDWYRVGVYIDEERRERLEEEYSGLLDLLQGEMVDIAELPEQREIDERLESVQEKLDRKRKKRNALRRLDRKAEGVFKQATKLQKLEKLCKRLEERRKVLKGLPTRENFNPLADSHARHIIVECRKIIPAKVTGKTNQLSLAEDSLFDHRNDEFVRSWFRWKKIQKLHSQYISGLHKLIDDEGRIHPSFNLPSTPTGRFGCSPNVQNWPWKTSQVMRKMKEEYPDLFSDDRPGNMRTMIMAPPGRLLIGADYAALELRIVAVLANQADLIQAFLDGEDIHARHAKWFFGEAFDEADPATRKILRGAGKPVTFGKNYRAGPQTLFETVREERDDEDPEELFREVKYMSEVLDAKYPQIVRAAEHYQWLASTQYELRTPLLGRLRKWPTGDPPMTETANFLVQSSAADIINERTLVWVEELKAEGLYHNGVWPNMQIHDHLVAEVDEEIAEREAKRLERCMTWDLALRSPFTGKKHKMLYPAEAKVGRRLSDV